MLCVIFGAGASFDSALLRGGEAPALAAGEYRPPLSKDLFGTRHSFRSILAGLPYCAAIIGRLRDAGNQGGDAIEKTLRVMQDEERNGYPQRANHLTAIRFYLQQALDQCSRRWSEATDNDTNYTRLVDTVASLGLFNTNEGVLFITFNYDTLLERALEAVLAAKFTSIVTSYEQNGFAVAKPHGSVNWGQECPWSLAENEPGACRRIVCDNPAQFLPTGDYALMNRPDELRRSAALLLPVIAIPVDQKSDFAWPSSHRVMLEKRLSGVSKLLVIGWRASEAHFLGLLGEQLPSPVRIMIVAESAEAARDSWINLRNAGVNRLPNGASSVAECVGVGFTEFVRSDTLTDFLRSG